MDEVEASRYWCYVCNQRVNPIMEFEESIKCPICDGGFFEEMATASASSSSSTTTNASGGNEIGMDFGGGPESDRALSLWAPILLGMMGNPRRRRRFRRLEFEDEYVDDNEDGDNNNNDGRSHRSRHDSEETDVDRELESTLRMRRRSSANILHLLHGIRAGMVSGSENGEGGDQRERREGGGERVILINPFNQTIIVQGSVDAAATSGNSQSLPIGSLGDYFIGPGLDMLLQHLAENDPNRYGSPPAQKEAVEALPTVTVEEDTLQCSVCLDDFEMGAHAREMPCKHKFHDGCILPWLEIHSSCPVCRYQLPADEPRVAGNNNSNNNNNNNNHHHLRNATSETHHLLGNNNSLRRHDGGEDGDEGNENGRRFTLPLPWPFSSFSGSQPGNADSGSPATSTTSPPAPPPPPPLPPHSSSHTHQD